VDFGFFGGDSDAIFYESRVEAPMLCMIFSIRFSTINVVESTLLTFWNLVGRWGSCEVSRDAERECEDERFRTAMLTGGEDLREWASAYTLQENGAHCAECSAPCLAARVSRDGVGVDERLRSGGADNYI
jgi:hypothetical protein